MFEALTVGRLRAQYAWLEPLVGGRAPGAAVTSCVYTFTIAAAALCAHNHFLAEPAGLWALLPDFILSFIIVACKLKTNINIIIFYLEICKTGPLSTVDNGWNY